MAGFRRGRARRTSTSKRGMMKLAGILASCLIALLPNARGGETPRAGMPPCVPTIDVDAWMHRWSPAPISSKQQWHEIRQRVPHFGWFRTGDDEHAAEAAAEFLVNWGPLGIQTRMADSAWVWPAFRAALAADLDYHRGRPDLQCLRGGYGDAGSTGGGKTRAWRLDHRDGWPAVPVRAVHAGG